ncbi:SGNH/GDSL hydrolase family protein [Aeromicrobium wangtongii]|uniref:SGNH/GDSL hydrolase family protein n=1 Tax=Aeromicrobium wangtongii TaxID=2969247 RepID=A0ABY5MDC6_9ACTN|nr:SGNH/GDSL hydrolase family protein [Aeromicrobium wangtongii]MCD9199473.1 SGNH/GDSL hydrolase family protein [Aeromicrobium wangtongii]UUP13826.1 SGNH/GDSL hydrolase family protein [Aeromicrobium wangtongii]
MSRIPTAIIFGDSWVSMGRKPGYSKIAPVLLGWRGRSMGLGGTGFVAEGPNGRKPYASRIPELLAAGADVLVLQGSGNDAPFEADEVEAAADQFLRQVSGHFQQVYMIGVPWAGKGRQTLHLTNAAYERAAEANGALFVPAENWLDRSHMKKDDPWHPSHRGHLRMARKVAAGIRRAKHQAAATV